MAGFATFDAEIDALGNEIVDTIARLADATPALESPEDDERAVAAAVVAEVLIDVSGIAEDAAELVLRFGEAADAVAADFASVERFRGFENIVGLFSGERRRRLRAARVRRLAPADRAHALLSNYDAACGFLDQARTALRLAHEECDRALDRLTGDAVAFSNEVVAAERRLGALVPEIAHLERRLGPGTDREAAVTLARDHAELAGERRAIVARLAALRHSREETHAAIGTIGPLFKGLSEAAAKFGVLRARLGADLEAHVVLFAAVAERLRLDRIETGAERKPLSVGLVAGLIALQAQGGLSMRDIERRRAAADAAFARRFPHLADPRDELADADDGGTGPNASTDDAQP